MWMNEFKVALVEQNIKALEILINTMPQFETLEEMEETFYLMKQAKELLEDLKNETAKSMKKIKENIRYIESTRMKSASKLDIMQ